MEVARLSVDEATVEGDMVFLVFCGQGLTVVEGFRLLDHSAPVGGRCGSQVISRELDSSSPASFRVTWSPRFRCTDMGVSELPGSLKCTYNSRCLVYASSKKSCCTLDMVISTSTLSGLTWSAAMRRIEPRLLSNLHGYTPILLQYHTKKNE